MAKFSRVQWALASNILKRARNVVKDAKRNEVNSGILYNLPKVPNREQLRKMSTDEASIILQDLSIIRDESDLRIYNRGGGNFLSNYEVERSRSAVSRNEERKRKLRERLNISTTEGTMGSEADTMTRPSKPFDYSNLPEDFKTINERIIRQSMPSYEQDMNKQYRDNYFRGLTTQYGIDRAMVIYELTKSLSDEDFFILSASNAELEINFYYYGSPEEANDYFNRIYQEWESLIIDTDIWEGQ